MTRIVKTTAAITTALMMGAGIAAPASADSAWPDVGERAGNEWTPGDGEPRPMDRSYFEDRGRTSQAGAGNATDEEGATDGFFATIIDAIQQVGDSG